jgi:hypothetical protein
MTEYYELIKKALESLRADKAKEYEPAKVRAMSVVITQLEQALSYAWMYLERP